MIGRWIVAVERVLGWVVIVVLVVAFWWLIVELIGAMT